MGEINFSEFEARTLRLKLFSGARSSYEYESYGMRSKILLTRLEVYEVWKQFFSHRTRNKVKKSCEALWIALEVRYR